jgi:RNA polymerase sigma factor (sigma-70 family)
LGQDRAGGHWYPEGGFAAVGGEIGVAASDGTLVLGVLNGDRSAYAELYDRRARLIRAICFEETRDFHAAADLAQEAFLRAYRNLRELRDPQRFSYWLTGIARQVCREWRRAKRRERSRLSGFAKVRMSGTAEAAGVDERLAELLETIAATADPGSNQHAGLDPRERLALHAYYAQGCNAEEARAVLGLSKSGFHRVLSSACERLRVMLGGQEVRP